MKRLLLICLLLAACAPSPPRQIDFTLIAQGAQSSITEEQMVAINSQADWQSFWIALNKASRVEIPISDEIFANQTVIAVFRGQQRSGGYGIGIGRIEEGSDVVRVYLERTDPAPGGIVSLGFTQPYVIVSIPKTAKPVAFSG